MSMTTDNKSTFLIKSSENGSFGTGFVVYKSGNISYMVTCAHVVGACGEDALLVNNGEATLVAIGAKEFIDLAVISVENLESVALKISDINVYEEMPFNVRGFKQYINQNHKFELLDGTIKKHSQIATAQKNIDIYELSLCLDDSIKQGYSGSAIYSTSSGYVFAVAISRSSDIHADAILIKYLKDIWDEMPDDLLIEESILDEEELDKKFLKGLASNIFGNNIEIFQRVVYSILPKAHNEVLPNDINKIIDIVAKSKDSLNRENIPFLCLAKMLNDNMENNELEKWIEYKKSIELLAGKELKCITHKLDSFYNILIEVIVSHKEIDNSTILVWEDKLFKEGEISYQNVIEEKGINLKDSEEIAIFLDKLIFFLKKFPNSNNLLLEFILPKVLLKEEINLWRTSIGDSLSSKYCLVYRFHERFQNYKDYHESWIPKWKDTYEDDNKFKKLGDISLILNSEEDKERINRTTKAIITTFPIANTDIFPKIYEYGASILIAPSSVLNKEELTLFNAWFREEFKDVKIEEMIIKINDFCLNNPNNFKSKMILIWDNPNRIPAKYKKLVKPSTPKGFEGFGFN